MIIHSTIHSIAFKILSSPFIASYNYFLGIRWQVAKAGRGERMGSGGSGSTKQRGIIPCGIMPLPLLDEEKR
jgi:hypothetical protein